MGYIAHHAIVVTSGSTERIAAARSKAIELGLEATNTVVSRTNGYVSFCITPDGSKEGWDASANAEEARAAWIEWVRGQHISYISWALIRFGGDDPQYACLEDHNGRPSEHDPVERAKRVTPLPTEGLPAPRPKLKP